MKIRSIMSDAQEAAQNVRESSDTVATAIRMNTTVMVIVAGVAVLALFVALSVSIAADASTA